MLASVIGLLVFQARAGLLIGSCSKVDATRAAGLLSLLSLGGYKDVTALRFGFGGVFAVCSLPRVGGKHCKFWNEAAVFHFEGSNDGVGNFLAAELVF